MIGWLKRAIAWAVARRDLEELERWRVESAQVRRWMAEFPDICTVLDHLDHFASGRPYRGLTEVRETVRKQRPPGAFTLTLRRDLTQSDIDHFKRLWAAGTWPGSLRSASLADLEAAAATDWDVAARS